MYRSLMSAVLEPVDQIFKALADPTRRKVIQILATGPQPFTRICDSFQSSQPAIIQHLKVLESANLIDSQKAGRVRTYQLNAQTLTTTRNWLDEQRQMWESRLDRLDALAIDLYQKQQKEQQT